MQQDVYTSLKTEAVHLTLASATQAKIFEGCATQRCNTEVNTEVETLTAFQTEGTTPLALETIP